MSRRDEFLRALTPLQSGASLRTKLDTLLPTAASFEPWEDSLWLGLFFARRLSDTLAHHARVDPTSVAGRIQGALEVTKSAKGAFFSSHALLSDLPFAIRRTCCVRLDDEFFGTGFLVGPDRVLTNWHVVRKKLETPASISVCFDYLQEAGVAGTTPIAIAVSSIIRWQPTHLERDAPKSEHPLDYALLGLSSSLPGDRGHVDLSLAGTLYGGSHVVVVGHPNGRPLAVSFSRERGIHRIERSFFAHYDADTLPGSSGSLVMLASSTSLVPALLHAGGLNPDENFGIALQAIRDDLPRESPGTSPEAPRTGGSLETFLDNSEERSGRLATLLALAPDDISLDVRAPFERQVATLKAAWSERLADALELAHMLPASRVSPPEVVGATPKPKLEEPVEDDGKTTAHPGLIVVAAILFVGVVFIFLTKELIDDDDDGKSSFYSCGLTVASYASPRESEFRCDSFHVRTNDRVQCKLELPHGTLNGECHRWQKSGRWTSIDRDGKLLWSIDFDQGTRYVPYVYKGVSVMANDSKDKAGAWSRAFTLPSKASVSIHDGQLSIRCGDQSFRWTDPTGTLRLDDGKVELKVTATEVTHGAVTVPIDLVDRPELSRQAERARSQLELCNGRISLEVPRCKVGEWASRCEVKTGGGSVRPPPNTWQTALAKAHSALKKVVPRGCTFSHREPATTTPDTWTLYVQCKCGAKESSELPIGSRSGEDLSLNDLTTSADTLKAACAKLQ